MPGRLLVATPSDVLGSPNSRSHHVVRYLAQRFSETHVLSRALLAHRTDWSALVRIRTHVKQEGPIRWISYNPWGHIRDGLGVHLLGLTNPYAVPRGDVRRLLRRIASPLGGVADLGLLPSLVAAYLYRVGGVLDVFVGQGPWEGILGVVLKAVGRVRRVVYDDIDYAPGFQPISGMRQHMLAALERAAIRRADVVISVGERLAALRRSQGVRQVRVIPNGVDLERFAAARRMRTTDGTRRPTLIYMGYLGAWAGVDLLLEAAALIARKIPDLRLILLGHASPLELDALATAMRDRELGNRVEFRVR